MAHEDLIDEIERDAIDHNTPIGVALCNRDPGRPEQIRGAHGLGDARLEGYLGYDGELPQYRVIYAPLMVDGATMTGMVQHSRSRSRASPSSPAST